MYATLISFIKTQLQAVTQIASGAVYDYPTSKLDKYPAVMFFPVSFENSFESVKENFKIYRFKMFVVVGIAQKGKSDVFGTVLAGVVDAILAKFDNAWDAGTISGHRAWMKIDSGDWAMVLSDNGQEAQAELNVSIKVLTNN